MPDSWKKLSDSWEELAADTITALANAEARIAELEALHESREAPRNLDDAPAEYVHFRVIYERPEEKIAYYTARGTLKTEDGCSAHDFGIPIGWLPAPPAPNPPTETDK